MEIKTVPLTRGAVALVSAEDYEMIMRHKWYVDSAGYPARTASGNIKTYMHRLVNRTPDGMLTDHIDGNKLNATRPNLRTVNPRQNCQNQSKQKRLTASQFKGVFLRPGTGSNGALTDRWAACLKVNRKHVHLGAFVTEMDAALAYNLKAKELFGEYSKPNRLPVDFIASRPFGPVKFKMPQTSKYIGVSFVTKGQRWLAYVNIGRQRVYGRWFKTELEACIAYNAAALRIHGDKARLNALPCAQKATLCPTTTLAT